MCKDCQYLEANVKNAITEKKPEKIRVMISLLASHRKNMHAVRDLTTIAPNFIAWPNGSIWSVKCPITG